MQAIPLPPVRNLLQSLSEPNHKPTIGKFISHGITPVLSKS